MGALILVLLAQSPPVTDGLELRFDASLLRANDGDPIDAWPDASGKERGLAAPNAQARPTFKSRDGATALRFDGRDDRLSGLAGLSLHQGTLAVFGAPHSNPGGFRGLASGNPSGKNDYTGGLNLDLGSRRPGEFACLNAEGAGFGGEQNLAPGPLPMGSAHALILRVAEREVRLFVDGQAAGSRPRTADAMILDEFRIGARHFSNTGAPTADGSFFHGDIAEVLLYGRALADAEIAALDGYLRKKHRALPPDPPPPPVTILVPGFTVRPLPVKLTNINSLEYDADGRLWALGYDGRVHVLTDSDGDGLEDKVTPFWYSKEADIRAPVGICLAPEGVYVACRGKIVLLKDTDGDGAADAFEVAADGWTDIRAGVDTVAVVKDAAGYLYFCLGTADYSNPYLVENGKSRFDLRSERGTIQKLSPDRKRRESLCTGVRFAVGMRFNRHGDLFATDQEGATWLPGGNPLDELLHIRPGVHYGFPPRHPEYLPNVVDEPAVVTFGPQHQSTCGLKFNEASKGWASFGPAAWEGDALVAGESRGKIWRVPLVKTPQGYVGARRQIATLTMLTIDVAVSPKGDLVATCHTGPPDWGTGPTGMGTLFKISYTDREAPQPTAIWPSGPMEVKVAFDRPIDEAALTRAEIEFGEFVSAADRLETLKPPYEVVQMQERAPRGRLTIAGRKLSEDRRTLTLSTSPHPWRATYATTLVKVGGATVDLEYDLHGVEATWTAGATVVTCWLPHLDLEVARALTVGSVEHDRFFALLRTPGILVLNTQVDGAPQSVREPTPVKRRLGPPIPPDRFLLPWAPAAVPPPAEPPKADASGLAGGDWRAGREIFFGDLAKCAVCHSIRGEGGKVAPDLTNLVHWAADRILPEILQPSATINPDYVNYRVEMKDGAEHLGVLFTEGADRLRVVDTNAAATVVARADVKELHPSAVSIMPEGFDRLGAAKLRDLMAFLTSAAPQEPKGRPAPRKRADVEAVLAKATQTAGEKPRPIEVVLVTGPKDHGPGEHDYPAWRKSWSPLLAKSPNVRVSTAYLRPNRGQWDRADVMVFFFMDGKNWNADLIKELDAYQARGGGLCLLHSACIPEKESATLSRRIGLAWEWKVTKFRHGALDLKLEAPDHPITIGLPERLALVDESYWPLHGDRAAVTVLATQVEDGAPQPILWTAERGKGRVVGSLLGHYAWTFEDPFARLITLRSIAWAAGEPADRFKALVLDGARLAD